MPLFVNEHRRKHVLVYINVLRGAGGGGGEGGS